MDSKLKPCDAHGSPSMPKSVLTDMLQLGTLWQQLHTKLGPTETQHGEHCFKQSVIDSKQTRKIPVKTSVLRISDRAGYVLNSEAIWISTWADMIETVWQICPLASTPKLSRLSTFGAGGFFCRKNLIENREPKRLTCICIYMFWMFRSTRASQVRRWWNGPPAVVRTTPPPKVGSATCPAFPEWNLTRPTWLISNDSTTAHLRASWICWWVWPFSQGTNPTTTGESFSGRFGWFFSGSGGCLDRKSKAKTSFAVCHPAPGAARSLATIASQGIRSMPRWGLAVMATTEVSDVCHPSRPWETWEPISCGSFSGCPQVKYWDVPAILYSHTTYATPPPPQPAPQGTGGRGDTMNTLHIMLPAKRVRGIPWPRVREEGEAQDLEHKYGER